MFKCGLIVSQLANVTPCIKVWIKWKETININVY